MFESLAPAPPDPILGLTEAFRRDPNPRKINLGVGVFTDESGQTPVLRCIKEAERRRVDLEVTKNYLGIEGYKPFDAAVPPLLLGEQHPVVTEQRSTTMQVPGGTGGLRVAADFIRQVLGRETIWLSDPTWPNHPSVFQAAGLKTAVYPYFDPQTNGLKFTALMDTLNRVAPGDVVLLHACCHNPTGVDPTPEQWSHIAEKLVERQAMPLVDFAYLGFGDGLIEDATGLRILADTCSELLVATSFSKNFGVYCERTGALTAITSHANQAEIVEGHLKRTIRTIYSNPPAHGGILVATVLHDPQLRQLWLEELAGMRDRINGLRRLFVDTMAQHGVDMSFLTNQRGMFSYSGLTPEQVDRLRTEYSIYIVRSGRISVAGMNAATMAPLCSAIAAVLGR